ncbi:MAG: Trx7/PDZ domain-containing (seleno)protein [Pirellulaceae bacterium]
MKTIAACLSLLIAFGMTMLAQAQDVAKTREEKVRGDREKLKDDDSWIYNDLKQGTAFAKAEGKPLLVIFRCLPCEACALFDEQVVRRDDQVRELMDKFICVRIPMANAMDLTRFQYDYDLSFSAFFMHPGGTIYGRFGTRSSVEHAESDISIEGFAAALEGALKLHSDYPKSEKFLTNKQPRPVAFESPEEYPSLKGKYKDQLDYTGKVVQSCLHCHQIRDAEREYYRENGEAPPTSSLRPYPMPQVLGFTLDEKTRGVIKAVQTDSAAAKAGLRVGDELLVLDGQAILSIADVQWVLHNAGERGFLIAVVRRDGQIHELPIELADGWRSKSDISWRVTSWTLRRMVTGGMKLEDLSDEDRGEKGVAADALALVAKSVGKYGPHAAARRAGFLEGDILLKVAGASQRMDESDLMTHLMQTTRPGQNLAVTVLRKGRQVELKLPMQK